jgi:hypothetical protein
MVATDSSATGEITASGFPRFLGGRENCPDLIATKEVRARTFFILLSVTMLRRVAHATEHLGKIFPTSHNTTASPAAARPLEVKEV